jgi:DNA-directed RNA polymerase subunit alpha
LESQNTLASTALKESLSQLASGELTREGLVQLARTVYAPGRPGGPDELRALLRDWDEVAALLPSRSPAGVLRGYAQYLLGDLEAAEETLKGQKRSEWGAYYYIQTLLDAGKLEEALKAAEDAHEKLADSLPLSYQLLRCYASAGKEAEAAKLLEKLRKANGSSAEFAFHAGFCQEKTGEYRQAIQSYRDAVSRYPDNSEALFRLGYLLDLYGTDSEEANDDAVAAYESCLRIQPVHTNAAINLGLLYEDRERYHDAVKCFETVLKAHPNHRRAKLFLQDALAATRMFYDKDQEKKADRHSQVLKIPVTDFELSVRSRNCLQKMNIDTLGDLIMKTEQELLSYKNFGETSLQEIKEMLSQKGLRLGQGLEEKGAEPPSGRNPLEATVSPEILDRKIEDLNLSVRSRRCMERLEVRTVRDLINKTEVELMSAKNFGMTSLNEIKLKLAELGLTLKS